MSRLGDLCKAMETLRKEGLRNSMVYMLGDAYQSNSRVINKALAIGFQKLKEEGEI